MLPNIKCKACVFGHHYIKEIFVRRVCFINLFFDLPIMFRMLLPKSVFVKSMFFPAIPTTAVIVPKTSETSK